MAVIPLVQRGLAASQVVFGCMSLGGGWSGAALDDSHIAEAERAVDAALEIGITMFDHADIYARGQAESAFGQVLKRRPGLRDQMVIQSKCGIRFGNGTLPTRYDFSKQHILTSVDGILSRLGIEQLDILLLHRPDPLMEPDEVAEAFGKLKSSGKVRYFGVSNMNQAQIRFLQRALPDQLCVNQLQLSLSHLHFIDATVHVNQDAGTAVAFPDGLLEFSQHERMQIQAWGPLGKGYLTGRDTRDQSATVQQTAALIARMAEEKGTSREAIALGWLMRHPAGIQPVIGTINPERVRACGDAERQAAQMTRDEWYTLYTAARGKNVP